MEGITKKELKEHLEESRGKILPVRIKLVPQKSSLPTYSGRIIKATPLSRRVAVEHPPRVVPMHMVRRGKGYTRRSDR